MRPSGTRAMPARRTPRSCGAIPRELPGAHRPTHAPTLCLLSYASLRVVIAAHEVQRHVGDIADDPRVMRLRWYVEEVTRAHFDHPAICEGSSSRACDHEPDMLDLTAILSQLTADVLGPAPAGLIGGALDRHAADAHELESAHGHLPHLIRMLKALQYHLRGHQAILLSRCRSRTRAPIASPDPLGLHL